MGNDIYGWGKLKEHLRNTNNTNEYYLDDSEHLIIFLNDKMNVQVYGYLIYQNKILPSYAKDILDFINYLEKIESELFDYSYNVQLNVICNDHMTSMKSGHEIKKLPFNVNYYYFNYNYLFDEVSKFVIQDLIESANKRDKWNTPTPKILDYEDVEDSRFEDWGKWQKRGYEREWYDFHELERFEDFQFQMKFANIICYKDERLMGFYVVWKWLKNTNETEE